MTQSYSNSVTDVVKQSESAMAAQPQELYNQSSQELYNQSINQASKSQEQEQIAESQEQEPSERMHGPYLTSSRVGAAVAGSSESSSAPSESLPSSVAEAPSSVAGLVRLGARGATVPPVYAVEGSLGCDLIMCTAGRMVHILAHAPACPVTLE